ncbi:MAG TPA: PilN domain-containing protein [Lacipirellulaceae bacterium]|jgi:Tfp pilus assembly protein PilN
MKSAINLLPPVLRRGRMLRRRAIQWGAVLCIVLVGAWAARWWKLREYHSLNQQLEAVAHNGRPAQVKLQEITVMRQQLRQLQQHEDVAKELQQQRQVLAVLGVVSQAARQSNGRLRVTDLKVTDFQTAHVADQPEKEPTRGGTVTLIGVSLDSPTVAEFHDTLERSGLFVDVKLIKSNARKENDTSLYEYEVCCEL